MLSKMRSLSFKLTLFYFISVFLIICATAGYLEYHKYEIAVVEVLRDVEIGPGFINGATPDDIDTQILYNHPDSVYNLKSADIENGLARFKPLFDQKVEGGVAVHSSIDGPISINHQDYYNMSFDIRNIKSNYQYKIGPITIPKSHFPVTVAAGDQSKRLNDFYYLPVPGHDNLIWVVSANRYDFPVQSWVYSMIYDIASSFPFILLLSVVFALLITWITVSPLKRITRSAEGLSRSDLSQRVKYKSNDEIGRLAISFNTMAGRLEESFNSQKRFVSDAAHELRTPLASMKTSVTKALSMESDSNDDRALLGFLSGRIDYMETLVNDLLFLSRVDEGQFKPNKAVLDLSKLLIEAEESFRCLFEDKDIKFTSEIAADLQVNADRTLILRVISNLLDNAAKNTSAGGVVSLSAIKQNNGVLIIVSDTGAGIPPEYLTHIFERFYKVPGLTRSNNGYGLGLAISKSIVESTGGRISVQSDPGKGSIFTIELPQYKNSNLI